MLLLLLLLLFNKILFCINNGKYLYNDAGVDPFNNNDDDDNESFATFQSFNDNNNSETGDEDCVGAFRDSMLLNTNNDDLASSNLKDWIDVCGDGYRTTTLLFYSQHVKIS